MAFSIVQTAKNSKEFLTEVSDELKKVTWPDWPQLKNATLVIIAFCMIVTLIIFLMDLIVKAFVGPTGLIMRLLGR